ncbi:MAG: hypothetical protein JW729_04955 [Bacteroidales bacterium]|nr:hypothetical protein [Bacteroidales bacterium]
MKKAYKIIGLFFLLFWVNISFAQAPPSPEDQEGGGIVGDVGGGAPIGSGVTIMIAAAAVYGFGKQKVIELESRD